MPRQESEVTDVLPVDTSVNWKLDHDAAFRVKLQLTLFALLSRPHTFHQHAQFPMLSQ